MPLRRINRLKIAQNSNKNEESESANQIARLGPPDSSNNTRSSIKIPKINKGW